MVGIPGNACHDTQVGWTSVKMVEELAGYIANGIACELVRLRADDADTGGNKAGRYTSTTYPPTSLRAYEHVVTSISLSLSIYIYIHTYIYIYINRYIYIYVYV
jgi:hypothetical protein